MLATLRNSLHEPQVRVALVTAVVLIVQSVLAKNVLDLELDFLSQNAPLLVFIAFLLGGSRSRSTEIAFDVTIVAVSAALLLLYSI
ncbi:MAG: hypothetical protein AB7J35_17510 [Dehalococcoidia bacterium]